MSVSVTPIILHPQNACGGPIVLAQRILIYGINYAPEPIGVGKYSGELGSYLSKEGFDVDVVTAPPHYPGWAVRGDHCNCYKVDHIDDVRVTRCPLLLTKNMRGIWRAIAPLSFAVTSGPVVFWRILTGRPDTVLCVEPTLFAAPTALLAAKLIGARTVLHVQDLEVDAAFGVRHLKGGLLKWIAHAIEGCILKSFDAVVTISNRMQDKLKEKGVRPERLSVIRNWVDLDRIKPLNGQSSYRKELGLSDEHFVALYAGNIGVKQALHIIFEAANHLIAEQNIVFVIAGEGPEKENLATAHGHLLNVRFLPIQPEERFCDFLNLADVHLLPQDRDAADWCFRQNLEGC